MGTLKSLAIVLCILFVSCTNIAEKEYYQNGGIKSIIKKNGKGFINGTAKYFYENGNLKSVDEYDHGDLKHRTVYYENGKVMWEVPYVGKKMNGDYQEYSHLGYLKIKGKVIDDKFVQYNKYDSLNRLVFEYVRIDTTQIPSFNNSFIHLEGKGLYLNKFSTVKLSIPSIPSSQLLPEIVNGTVQLVDRINGIWEAKAHSKEDSVIIGITIYIDDSTKYLLGYNKYQVVQ